MDYLTSTEIAKIWGLTGRMVAYHCEAGRVQGAIKKGKVWLIPAGALPPIDGRRRKDKIKIADTAEAVENPENINKIDIDNLSQTYQAGDIYRNFGLTRETLRYYEEQGLIKPKRRKDSKYREFNIHDIYFLMSIDFYRKRGFSAAEIQEIMLKSSAVDLTNIFKRKQNEIETSIRKQQRTLKRLQEILSFNERIADNLNTFSVQSFPLYEVEGTFSAVSAFDEYKENVIGNVNLTEQDILSKMIRSVTFDDNGFKGTQMCIVKKAEVSRKSRATLYLESGKSLYTVIEVSRDDEKMMGAMYEAAHSFAKGNGITFKGVAYINTRLILFSKQTQCTFLEVWMPIK